MAELTNEQLLLMEIRDKLCGGNAAELARRIGKDATYVNRLFYPKDKAGHKGIGLGIMTACNRAFDLPGGFWDAPSPALTDEVLADISERHARRNFFDERREAMRAQAGDRISLPGMTVRLGKPGEPRVAHGMSPILAWEHPDDLPEGDFVMIPRLDVHLSAGGGRDQVEIELVKDNPQAFRTEWIRLMRLKPSKLAAMRASGESMENTIHDGDSLLVDTSQTNVVDDKVYALWYDGGERVKRLFRLPGGGLRIHSDNLDKDKYPDMILKPEDLEHVRIIGRVVHKSGTGGL